MWPWLRSVFPCRVPSCRTSASYRLREGGDSTSAQPGVFALSSSLRRVLLPSMQLCCLSMLAGCVTAPPHPMDKADPTYAIAVVPGRPVQGTGFGSRPYGETLAQGAAAGIGAGALGGAVMLGLGAAVFPPLAVPFALIVLGSGTIAGLGVAAIGAPASGGATTVSQEQRATLDRAMSSVLSDLPPAEHAASAIARNVATFTPFRAEVLAIMGPPSGSDPAGYLALRDRGFGGALEISFTQIGFAGWNAEGVFLYVTAEARLFDLQTGNLTWLRGMVYESHSHSATRWLRDDAALTRAELERAYQSLAERVVDVAILSTEPATHIGPMPATCGVPLLEPGPVSEAAPPYRQNSSAGSTVRVDSPALAQAKSIAPVLTWAAQPLPAMFDANPWATVKEVRYDLRIWNVADDAPTNIVYERYGLTEPRHQVEAPLQPASTYFWSVRMRGTVDGHLRATPWSASREPMYSSKAFLKAARYYGRVTADKVTRVPCEPLWPWCVCVDHIPDDNYYRFRTP